MVRYFLLLSVTSAKSYNYYFFYIYHFYTGALDKGVVLVRCGINWGTGVLVHKNTGTFLTCSHVVAEVRLLKKYEEYL